VVRLLGHALLRSRLSVVHDRHAQRLRATGLADDFDADARIHSPQDCALHISPKISAIQKLWRSRTVFTRSEIGIAHVACVAYAEAVEVGTLLRQYLCRSDQWGAPRIQPIFGPDGGDIPVDHVPRRGRTDRSRRNARMPLTNCP
jgi:hypothetical protein